MVYPTLQAKISDVAEPSWRASALGVYRFRRDSGYAIGSVRRRLYGPCRRSVGDRRACVRPSVSGDGVGTPNVRRYYFRSARELEVLRGADGNF